VRRLWRWPRPTGGFSFVETVVVLVLLSVLLGAALPWWQRGVAENRLVGAQTVLVQELRTVAERARSGRQVVCAWWEERTGSGGGFRLWGGPVMVWALVVGGACGQAAGVFQVTELPGGIRPQSRTQQVRFDGLGRLADSTEAVEVVLQDPYGRRRRVVVTPEGRVEAGN